MLKKRWLQKIKIWNIFLKKSSRQRGLISFSNLKNKYGLNKKTQNFKCVTSFFLLLLGSSAAFCTSKKNLKYWIQSLLMQKQFVLNKCNGKLAGAPRFFYEETFEWSRLGSCFPTYSGIDFTLSAKFDLREKKTVKRIPRSWRGNEIVDSEF